MGSRCSRSSPSSCSAKRTCASFSSTLVVQVEYTSRPPGRSNEAAWRSRRRCSPVRLSSLSPCQSLSTCGCFSAVPQPEQGGSSRIASHEPGRKGRASPLYEQVAACIRLSWCRLARRVPRRVGEGSLPSTKPLRPTSWARKPVLLPGLAHMSSTALPAAGASASGGNMDERSCI